MVTSGETEVGGQHRGRGEKLQYYMKLCESFENCKALKNLKNHPNFKIFF